MNGFTRIATGHDATDISLAVTALEGAGFMVLTPGRHTNSVVPHMSLAFGGVPIMVPDHDAPDARDLLAAIDAKGIKIDPADLPQPYDDTADIARPLGVLGRFKEVFFFWLGGVSRPIKGLFLNDRPKD
ncbi:hypothetical protein [Jannaschia pohangensis]|uniref:Signal transducing protein n=1 Tax=Jannaschia pohangensis TaxID=390807 RepID=A0A1I3TYT6_9RHOB|nr:hypothetical protein [Jannaschia pohangensis]SFJ75802.1 hypothetical protein SAMN04488095_3588 [Jannaschia pohangensis]